MRKKQLLAVLLTVSLADPSSVIALVSNSPVGGGNSSKFTGGRR